MGLFFALAPTVKNSTMTSMGMPLVSGTLKKTKDHEMRLANANKLKTPGRPMEESMIGKV